MHTKVFLNQTGISRDTLRYWRMRALLQPQRDERNGYLIYTEQDIQRALFIKEAQAIGFTLSEISNLLTCIHNAPCKHKALLPTLERHYDELTERIYLLQKTRRRLKKIIADFRERNCTKRPSDFHLS